MREKYEKKLIEKYTYLPWLTFPAIEYLLQLDLRDKTLFEWGSGDSTLFFSERCKKVISIEHDSVFFKKLENKPENVDLRFCPNNLFSEIIESFKEKFDVIFIDSEQRIECTEKALKFIKSDGLIIFDNANWHSKCCAMLRNANFLQIDFHGMGPRNDYAWTTSFFFTRLFNFKPLMDYQPHCPLFGNIILS